MYLPPMARPRRIALLGAESTGKTQLAQALGLRLQQQGLRVTVVPEVLREWCDRQGRTQGPMSRPGSPGNRRIGCSGKSMQTW
jgi:molybdopterin-guanine dinucleotide biosynthesis protein